MVEEKPARSRFGRIRGVGENVTDAVQAVTGQSAADDIAEFTDAYTEVLTGLHEEVQLLGRKFGESERQSTRAAAKLRAELLDETARQRRTTRIAMVTAAVAVTVGIIAAVLAVTI